MAKKEVTEETLAKVETPRESVYSKDELVQNYRALGTCYAIAKVALEQEGIKEATVSEAKKIIERFRHKEVK